ncbi:MAG: hypothetical protein JOZ78_21265 [Chroococcidiopsidaceae cyanobacterium CP_BM_ER_R8_30]|nr:hypothetical protein [Chroococcidiopsidaceae cyanobacterium CP_BM_ER_R8_30]
MKFPQADRLEEIPGKDSKLREIATQALAQYPLTPITSRQLRQMQGKRIVVHPS